MTMFNYNTYRCHKSSY